MGYSSTHIVNSVVSLCDESGPTEVILQLGFSSSTNFCYCNSAVQPTLTQGAPQDVPTHLSKLQGSQVKSRDVLTRDDLQFSQAFHNFSINLGEDTLSSTHCDFNQWFEPWERETMGCKRELSGLAARCSGQTRNVNLTLWHGMTPLAYPLKASSSSSVK